MEKYIDGMFRGMLLSEVESNLVKVGLLRYTKTSKLQVLECMASLLTLSGHGLIAVSMELPKI